MNRFFSPSTGGFYTEALHGPRSIEQALTAREAKAGKRGALLPNPECRMPGDVVPVSEERYAELMKAQAEGLQIVTLSGRPAAIERVIDSAERVAGRRRERDRRLAASDWTQLPDTSPAGGKAAWAHYRQALRDLDLGGSDWPTAPGSDEGEA